MNNISLGKYTTAIYRHIQILINKKLNKYNIGSGQYIFLYCISESEGITQKELSELINIDKATTAKAIKKLEEEKYIRRQQDENDKRNLKIYLTEKGQEFIPILKNELKEITEILSKGMSKEEILLADSLLERMLKNSVDAVSMIREK